MVFAIYLLAGIIPPQSVDYSGVKVNYDAEDYKTEYEQYEDIVLNDSDISIASSGTYRISGAAEDCSVYIAAEDGGVVHLILDNASIVCKDGPAVYIASAGKVIFTTTEDSNNTINTTVSGGLESAIYSDADITFNGNGMLNVSSENGIAVNCNTNVRFAGGSYSIKAKENGIKASYSVSMQDGSVALFTGSDAIKTTAGGQTSGKWIGVVDISGGALDIESDGDGINSNSIIAIGDASVHITCGGGSTEMVQNQHAGGRPGMDMVQNDDNGTSCKGLKAETGICISGGIIELDCADDAVHSNGDVSVNGGQLNIQSDGDGLQGDKTVNVAGGEIDITRCAEGICGRYITVSDGTVNIVASDDGINATNGDNPIAAMAKLMEMELFGTGGRLIINGGTMHIIASGDGLDANGSIKQSGGEVYVSSVSNGVEVPLDYDGTYKMTGGKLLAFGNGGRMLQGISENGSTVYSITVGANISDGSKVRVVDKDGNEILAVTSESSCSSLILASDRFTDGMNVTVYVDDVEIGSTTLTEKTSTIGTVSDSFGDMGGRPDDMQGGQKPSGQMMPDMPNNQMPGGMQDNMSGRQPDDRMGNGMPGMRGPFGILPVIIIFCGLIIVIFIYRNKKKNRSEEDDAEDDLSE